ncbi:MAG: glycosyltransferase [Thermoproteota archaeon]|nr:glycosyltransferase [Thermoproteota archaeon]
MKAALFHHNLNSAGGELSVLIETIQSLHDLGYKVHLNTIQKPKLEEISKRSGKNIPVSSTRSIFPFKMNYFGVYQRLFEYLPSFGYKDADIIVSTNGGFLPCNIPNNIPIVTYVHFLPSLLTSPLYANSKYTKSLKWKVYFKPYQSMANKIVGKTLSKSSLCITNSKFTDDAVRSVYPKINSTVIHPPVDVDKFLIPYQSKSRDRQVVVISRFSPEKQIEKAVTIAKMLSRYGIKFKILGSLIPSNNPYFHSIQKMVATMNLVDMVTLVPNATFEQIQNAMSESRVYLHTMAGEHFGVSIVEAMAGGLVPVVPSFGGCSEIVDPQYQYGSLEVAAKCILNNMETYNDAVKEEIHGKSTQYSSTEFRKKLAKHIENLQHVTP